MLADMTATEVQNHSATPFDSWTKGATFEKATFAVSLTELREQGKKHVGEITEAISKIEKPSDQLLKAGFGHERYARFSNLTGKKALLESYIAFAEFLMEKGFTKTDLGKPEADLFGYLPDPLLAEDAGAVVLGA